MRKMTFVFALLASSIVASDAFASLKVTLFAPNNTTVEINDSDAGQSSGSVVVLSSVSAQAPKPLSLIVNPGSRTSVRRAGSP